MSRGSTNSDALNMRAVVVLFVLAASLAGAAFAAPRPAPATHFGADGFGGPAAASTKPIYVEHTVQTRTLRQVTCTHDRSALCFAS
jgi:hypothetical protein